jgi:hypothetical protein
MVRRTREQQAMNNGDITNTSKIPFEFGTPGHVTEAVEARGQREMVQSTKLPVEGSENPALAEMGFRFGAVVPGDPLFREATLPTGWKKVGSSHSMYSYIVDTRGIRRVTVFYKAASYDRQADITLQGVDYAVWSVFIEGEGSIPWALLTADEKESTVARLRDGLKSYSDPKGMGRYSDSPQKVAKIKAELAKVGA